MRKRAVDEVDQAMRQIAREIGAEIRSAVFAQAPGDEHFRVAIAHSQLDVGVGLVVAQQDVEARLALLDQVVLERQGFALVGHHNVFEVHGFAHQRAGLAIVDLVGFEKVRAHTRAQVLRLADVDHLAFRVLVQVTAGRGRQRANFLSQVHKLAASSLDGLAKAWRTANF